MKDRDIKEGTWVRFRRYIGKPTFPGCPSHVMDDGYVMAKRGKTIVIQYYFMTWDYENRPDGVSEIEWMNCIDERRWGRIRKPVRRSKLLNVPASKIVGEVKPPRHFEDVPMLEVV